MFLLSVAAYGCMPKLNDVKQTFILLAALWVRNLERVQPGSWSLIHMACAKVAGAEESLPDGFFIHTQLAPGLGWQKELAADLVPNRQLSFHVTSTCG